MLSRSPRFPQWILSIGLFCTGLSGCDSLEPIAETKSRSVSDRESKRMSGPHDTVSQEEFSRRIDPSYGKKHELRFLRAPKMRSLEFPLAPGMNAIWGATGRDHLGRVYLGVSAWDGGDDPSASLWRYDSGVDSFELLGDVNQKLGELGIRRKNPFPETQIKIHSKIVQASDGRMYFSSQDEHQEKEDGSSNALFGGRLFSLDPVTDQWECVHKTPEGLIAVAGRGRYVVTQGYFGHTLYQYDTQTKAIRRVALGTYKGHVSRNIFMDRRGHVYGIRAGLANDQQVEGVYKVGQDRVRVSLVELSTEFEQVHEWPLSDYSPSWSTDSHGITGYCEFNNGNIVFVTHTGALWQISLASGSAELERLGWIAPHGSAYCASLFAPYGDRYVGGVVSAKEGYQWALFDVLTKRSVILKLDPATRKLLETPKLLIYGCETLDERGCGYLVGWKAIPRGVGPHVIEVRWE